MRKSRAETAETRARILSTASKMFLDKGLGAVGMRDMMAGASLAPGGFYRHFGSKDRLIAEASQCRIGSCVRNAGERNSRANRRLRPSRGLSLCIWGNRKFEEGPICALLRCLVPNSAIRTHKCGQLPSTATSASFSSLQIISKIGPGAELLSLQAALSARS